MNESVRLTLILLTAPVLLACSFAALLSTPTPESSVVSTPSELTTAVPLEQMEGEARQVVADFLNALKNDPSGQSALPYLAAGVSSAPAELAATGNGVPAFQLSAVTFGPDGTQATVDATLLYAQPENRRFSLTRGEWGWRIESISVTGGESGYPTTPEEVVQGFLLAYQETPDQMGRYLSADALARLPAGGAVGMLAVSGELEGYMIDSAAVNPNEPPRAEITVGIRAGGQDLMRVFDLTRENGLWKIRAVLTE